MTSRQSWIYARQNPTIGRIGVHQVESVDEALGRFFQAAEESGAKGDDLFESARSEGDDADLLKVGKWATLEVRLPNYHSEMPSPFLDAYAEVQDAIYRLAAYVEYGNADIRNLTFEDYDRYLLVVKVTEGSAEYRDNIPDIINRIAEIAYGKMNGPQAVIVTLGLGLLICGAWGFSGFVDARKEVRLAEISSEERKVALEALTFATTEHRQQMDRVLAIMESEGGAAKRAADTALATHAEVLRAASRIDETEVGSVHLSREEARELRSSPRRRSTSSVVEQEMRVVDVNTSDPSQTTVIIEDLDTSDQHRVTFPDRMLAIANRDVVFEALRTRGTALFKLRTKRVEGDIVSVTIMSVEPAPPATDDGEIETRAIDD